MGKYFDSSFFTADTLFFIKSTNKEQRDDIKEREKSFLETRSKLVHATDFVNISFKNGKKVMFCESYQGGYMNAFWTVPIEWNLKDDTITLTSPKFTWKFLITSLGTAKFEHLISNTHSEKIYETLSTLKMTVKRIK